MNNKLNKRLCELEDGGEDYAVATIIHTEGSSPGKSGSKMIVFPDRRTEFTVGGGALEEIVKKRAYVALKKGKNTKFTVKLDQENGSMACGGEAEVFIEVFYAPGELLIFGGGHIALALASYMDILGIPYSVYDNRPEYSSSERFPGAGSARIVEYEKLAQDIDVPAGSYCVIITHGHMGDKAVLSGLLHTDAKYLGMIGSKDKVSLVFDELEKEGMPVDMDRIYSPIGLDIGGDSPAEIALSIVAEIMTVRYGAPGGHVRDKKT